MKSYTEFLESNNPNTKYHIWCDGFRITQESMTLTEIQDSFGSTELLRSKGFEVKPDFRGGK